jgi:predicted DsbA family dithiol-disulfide isomerase
MAVAAGTAGLLLVALQWFVLRRTCQFCLVVDVVAMLLAAVALGWPRRPETVCASRRLTWAWPLVALGAAGVPLLWSALRPSPEVPLEVQQAWWVGKVNLVEITDFTCPYCRATHAALEDLRHNDPEALHFVRFLAPAPGDEPGWAAARAYHCALRQAAGQRVAHALFTTNDYSPENLREIARQAGLDAARYDADWSDLSIDREIELTRQWVGRLGSTGVPQVWVQDILLFGEQTPASLRSAIRRARLREQPTAVGQPLAPMLN